MLERVPPAAPDVSSRPAPLLITVAICTRNRSKSLEAAVNSVIPQLTDETELLIIDNASSDDTPKLTSRFAAAAPNVRVWREDQLGISRARNAALQQARGRYVLFFDDDERAEPGWLAVYLEFLHSPPTANLGCAGGPYLPDETNPPPPWMNARHASFDLGGEQRRLTGKTGPAGGNCAYNRALVLQLGGFALDLPRAEDSEMNWRLRNAGYEVWWLPQARIRHCLDPQRFRVREQLRLAFCEGRAAAMFRRKQAASPGRARLLALGRCLVVPFHVMVCAAYAVAVLLMGRTQAAFDALLRIFRNLGVARELLSASKPLGTPDWKGLE